MKRIPSFTILLLMCTAALVGIVSMSMLNVQYTPQSAGRSISVSWGWTGASSRVMEAEVTSKLEGVLSTVRNVVDISSSSGQGWGEVVMVFTKGTNMAAARFEVASKIRNAYSSLPDGVSYPDISLDSRGGISTPALTYVIKSPLPSREIAKFIRSGILAPISAIEGVERVSIWGETPFEFEIVFDQKKASVLGITADDISEAFIHSNTTSLAGLSRVGDGVYAVKLKEMDCGGVGGIPIKKVGSQIIKIGDIATWSYRESSPASYHRVNGLNTMSFSVMTDPGMNMLKVTSAVKRTMVELSRGFPEEITADLSYDSSEYVRTELRKIYGRTALCILILLLFVFITSRSWRYLFIVASTLFVSIFVAIVFYNIFRLPIHIYTLAGITVSLGIVIDTSIVMASHYSYYRDHSVFPALLAATATTICALSVVWLLPETDRANLVDFSKAICINLAVSLLTAYFFIPSLIDRYPLTCAGVGKPQLRRLRRIAVWNQKYSRYISWGIRHKWVFVLAMVVMCGASFPLFKRAVDSSNFYRQPEQPMLYIEAGMPEGSSVSQLNEVVKSMEIYLAGFPEISRFITNVRSSSSASIEVYFTREAEKTSIPLQIKANVTSMAINFGGANWRVSGLDNNYFNNHIISSGKGVVLELSGYNYDRLVGYAEILMEKLESSRRVHSPEYVDSWGTLASNEYNVDWDFGAMALRDVNPYGYYRSLYSRLYDNSLGNAEYCGEYVPAVLKSDARDEFDLWHVENAQTDLDSLKVKFSEMGSISKRRTGLPINKINQSYIIKVGFDFVGSYELEKRFIEQMVNWMNDEILPLGFKAKGPERWIWSRESKLKHAWLILLVILIIYVICAMIFESLRLPLAVILTIPIAFVGAFLTFGAFSIPFDQGGFAAFVMLCGLVVNAGIYLINAWQRDTRGGSDVRRFVKAYNHKITPILLTVLSTMLGLVPFLFDGPSEVFWFAFAAGAIGGMLFSLPAIIFLLPVFCFKS